MSIPMRRSKQKLSFDESVAILDEGIFGVMGTVGADGYPYAVPVSYAYTSEGGPSGLGRIFIHCALEGHKLTAIERDPHVSFTVISDHETCAERLTSLFRSVIAFGSARIAADDEEKREALLALGRKYAPGLNDFVEEEIDSMWRRTQVLVIDINELTGKEAIELTRERTASTV